MKSLLDAVRQFCIEIVSCSKIQLLRTRKSCEKQFPGSGTEKLRFYNYSVIYNFFLCILETQQRPKQYEILHYKGLCNFDFCILIQWDMFRKRLVICICFIIPHKWKTSAILVNPGPPFFFWNSPNQTIWNFALYCAILIFVFLSNEICSENDL